MEAYEGLLSYAGSCVAVPAGERAGSMSTRSFASGAAIMVSGDGSRMIREDETSRHGHVRQGDVWINIRRPLKSYIICTEEIYEKAVASNNFPQNALNVQQAASIPDLARLIDIDPDALTATVERFNSYAQEGYDPEFGRSAASMAPITGGSFYAIETNANMLNTQGGPRRNENAEVLDVEGNPIPHLYAAGELGGITAFQYQGGGNMAECVIFGKIAGKNAAAVKDELPVYEIRPYVESKLTYTLGAETDLGASVDVTLGENEYLGVSHNAMGGDLYVKVTMNGDQIANVEVLDNKETEGIGTKAIEAIPDAIAKANSTEVDDISSATITSKAIKEAVDDALAQIK